MTFEFVNFEKFPELPISNGAQFLSGFAFKSNDFCELGIPVIKIKNIQNKTVNLKDSQHIPSNLISKNIEKVFLNNGDILIAMTGQGSVGRVGRLRCSTNVHPLMNQRVGKFIADEVTLNKDYLFYVISSEKYERLLFDLGSGSGQPNLSPSNILSVSIPFPEYRQQLAISNILNMLDDRIKLLEETNSTLEEIIKAIFKSWFVDFDPVRAKLKGKQPEGFDPQTAALFPDSFEQSELGEIPKGWCIASFGSVCSVTIGGLWGSDTNESPDLVQAISLRGVDLEHLRACGFAVNAPVRWVKPSALEERRLSRNEVLIASSGAGPCGRALWAGADFESFYELPVIFSNFVKRLDCKTPSMAIYIDRILTEMRESEEIWNYINGTSVPNLDDKLLMSTKKIVVPPKVVLEAFAGVISTIYTKLYSQQAQTLSNLRDTLLPRLISGQLRLPDAEELIEAATA